MLSQTMQTEMPATGHVLADTIARFVWLLPLLPLLGFLANGFLSLKAAAVTGPADPSAAGHHDAHDAGHDARKGWPVVSQLNSIHLDSP